MSLIRLPLTLVHHYLVFNPFLSTIDPLVSKNHQWALTHDRYQLITPYHTLPVRDRNRILR